MKYSYLILLVFILCLSCSSDKDEPLSGDNFITSFKLFLNNSSVEGNINQSTGEITFDVTGADLNNLTPIIVHSEKSNISPSSITPQNFNDVVVYNVTAENGDVKTYIVNVENRPFNTESEILSFSFDISGQTYNCNIDNNTNVIFLETVGLDLTSIAPSITISENASISPSPSIPQNFGEVITYVVTAEDGTSSSYQVQIDNRPIGTESKILSFSIEHLGVNYAGIINEQESTISINLANIDISSLTPDIIISDYATISPEDTIAQDFNNHITYTVTAENGDFSTYTVIANEIKINAVSPRFSLNYIYYTGAELNVFGNYINPEIPESQLILRDGSTEYLIETVNLISENVDSNNASVYQISFTIPENIPTSNNYRLIYRLGDNNGEFNIDIDIMSDGPENMTINQTSYNYNDVLIVNGINLVPGLVVPSNGNNYIVENSNNYDIEVNPEGTQLTWTLDFFQHFPSYYGQAPQLKKVYTLGQNRRVGKAIFINFN
ncbi:MAG: DUF5018 domain-containing protein [Winogradskyella sp.]|uniref:DUF5018 domain-containing protein n=1 Tax=Winogradskyella sp. TaxID=1883156 RepID=UPI0025E9F844|nr:DUF5018 domain-containing protein [Winogradskyella sp.]NRB82466.1 DUF5018 domain-containing protein [Winogradskyella sp.]